MPNLINNQFKKIKNWLEFKSDFKVERRIIGRYYRRNSSGNNYKVKADDRHQPEYILKEMINKSCKFAQEIFRGSHGYMVSDYLPEYVNEVSKTMLHPFMCSLLKNKSWYENVYGTKKKGFTKILKVLNDCKNKYK